MTKAKRINFTPKVIRCLGNRVAWRCSFPGCNRITIGPGSKNNEDVIILGVAAHIEAASLGGPRANPKAKPEQIKSIDNGIWLCQGHARIIDVDYTIYSTSTLKLWKEGKEKEIRKLLETLDREPEIPASTLIQIGDIIFNGRWIYASTDEWHFEILWYLEGSETGLLDYLLESKSQSNRASYVLVESQGDGRLFSTFSLDRNFNSYNPILKLSIEDKLPRQSLDLLADIELDNKKGDFAVIKGVEVAKRQIDFVLNSRPGDLIENPLFGSRVKRLISGVEDQKLLNSLLKLEITRLLTIPEPMLDSYGRIPIFAFINRVNSISIKRREKDQKIGILLSLEWSNFQFWEGEISIG